MSVIFEEYGVYTGKENMQKDSDLLNQAIESKLSVPIFRLYGWKPACVSLGRNQDESFLDNGFLKANGVDVVRRLTGGRALLHDNELTYSYVTPVNLIENGDNIIESYKCISGIWIDVFRNLGIELSIGGQERHITKNNYCMAVSTGADICWNNRKFIGSAQCRKEGYILQHGSILLDYDVEFLDKIFREKTDFSSIVSLKEINGDITLDDIITVVKKRFRVD